MEQSKRQWQRTLLVRTLTFDKKKWYAFGKNDRMMLLFMVKVALALGKTNHEEKRTQDRARLTYIVPVTNIDHK